MNQIKHLCFAAGTGEHASQQGMNIGGIRHVSDIKADDLTLQSQGMLHPQTGQYLCQQESTNSHLLISRY